MLLGGFKAWSKCSEYFLLAAPVGQIDNQVLHNISQIVVVDVDSWFGDTTCLPDLMSKQVIKHIPCGSLGLIEACGRRHAVVDDGWYGDPVE